MLGIDSWRGKGAYTPTGVNNNGTGTYYWAYVCRQDNTCT